jgi:hypothetical protein
MPILMGCMVGVETAAFPGQTQEEIDRLLHMVGFVTISSPVWVLTCFLGCCGWRPDGH